MLNFNSTPAFIRLKGNLTRNALVRQYSPETQTLLILPDNVPDSKKSYSQLYTGARGGVAGPMRPNLVNKNGRVGYDLHCVGVPSMNKDASVPDEKDVILGFERVYFLLGTGAYTKVAVPYRNSRVNKNKEEPSFRGGHANYDENAQIMFDRHFKILEDFMNDPAKDLKKLPANYRSAFERGMQSPDKDPINNALNRKSVQKHLKTKIKLPEPIAKSYPLARSGGYLNNCGMHSVIHLWLSLPEEQIRNLADQHRIFDMLFRELFNYYQLPGEYNREAIFALNRQFNHPRDREILWGQVFRRTLRNVLTNAGEANDADSIRDLEHIPDDLIGLLTRYMGANLEVHNNTKIKGAHPIGHYNIEAPQWQLSLHHVGDHYNFSFNNDNLNARHNAAYANKKGAKLYRASQTGGHNAFSTPGVPEIQKQAIQQIVTRAFLNPQEEIVISDNEPKTAKRAKSPKKPHAKPFVPGFNAEKNNIAPTIAQIKETMKSDEVRTAFDHRSDQTKAKIATIFLNKVAFDKFKRQTAAEQLDAIAKKTASTPRTVVDIKSAMKSDAVRNAFEGRSESTQDAIALILSRDDKYNAFIAKTEAEQIVAVSRKQRSAAKP